MPTQSVWRLVSIAAACLIVITSAGCAAEAQTAGQGGAEVSPLCLNLEEMNRALSKATTLSSFSTPGNAKTARAGIDTALAAVEESAAIEQVDIGVLTAEVAKLDAFATRVPPAMTLGQSGRTIAAQAAVVGKERDRVAAAAGCTAAT
jgi:hypothetical protein